MKSLYRWGVVCACTIIVGGIVGWAARLVVSPGALKAKLASELTPADPEYKRVMCGPSSLSIALARLGVSRTQAKIAVECRVTAAGVTLTDLERVADRLPTVRAVAKKLRWDDLKQLDGVAVLFVKANHYVAVDPREVSSDVNQAKTIRLYDGDSLARWYSRSQLEEIWSGEALEITKQDDKPDAQSGARIAWDECYIDKGVVTDSSSLVRFRFSFHNVGRQELVIGDIERSCGCMDHRLSRKQLAPGESGEIEVDVNLKDKEGSIHQRLVVASNDSNTPASFLFLVCGVPRQLPLSTEAMRLEDLRQGSGTTREFVVSDRRFSGIQVREATFALRDSTLSADDISCSLDWEMIKENADTVKKRTGFAAAPEDYLVRLAFHAGKNCPAGPFEGDVKVAVEVEGSVVTHKVAIQGVIVQDVQPVPRLALISLDSNGVGSETLQLESASGQQIAVTKVWSDAEEMLTVSPGSTASSEPPKFVIRAQNADVEAGAAPLKYTVFFKLKDGLVISLPVTIFKPPRQP